MMTRTPGLAALMGRGIHWFSRVPPPRESPVIPSVGKPVIARVEAPDSPDPRFLGNRTLGSASMFIDVYNECAKGEALCR